jgi:hypothetical protein
LIFTKQKSTFTEKLEQRSSEKYNPYHYSKTLAEKKGWEIAKKQNVGKLTTINPDLLSVLHFPAEQTLKV